MALDPSRVGVPGPETHVSWTVTDTMLYALTVGAGSVPSRDLAYTTENSAGIRLRAMPGLALVLGQKSARPWFGEVDRSRIVHGEQAVTWMNELPSEGEAIIRTSVIDMADKGAAALVTTETIASSLDDLPLFTSRSTLFLRGHGGFGRSSTLPRPDWRRPERLPDHVTTVETLPQQALLYRLNFDRNPLHSDPSFAAEAGFARPILHGLCTYGFGLKALVDTYGEGDAMAARHVTGRFSAPVYPGDTLTIDSWRSSTGHVLFQILNTSGEVVVDHGEFSFR